MVQNKQLLIGYKLFFGLLGFSAIVTEAATLIERGRFYPPNFFSYFTVESNILAVAVLLMSALAVAAGLNAKLDVVRSMVAAYMLIVGIGFAVLLSGLEDAEFTAVPWNNTVLHYIMPAAVLVDLIVDRPKRRIAFGHSFVWLVFPMAYMAYSLIRGAATGWYPYPFMNPAKHGYAPVVAAIVGLTVLALGIQWFVTWLSNRRTTKR